MEEICPPGKELFKNTLGFLGSLWHRLASIVEKWGPVGDKGNTASSSTHLADWFEGLGKCIMNNRARQLTASTVAWNLLMALNHLNISEQNQGRNYLLHNWIKEPEQKLAVLTDKTIQTGPILQVRVLPIASKGDPKTLDPHIPNYFEEEF